MRYLALVILIFIAFSTCVSASPCDGIDRSLPDSRKEDLAPEIAKQLHIQNANILQSFKLGKWNIIYVETYMSDEVFLFYAHNPLTSHYVAEWSGAAMSNEEKIIRAWVLKNVPGIPKKLAACFARHVTKGRDM